MSTFYNFTNSFPVANIVIPNGQLTSEVTLLEDDGFVTITYSGNTTSRWFKFVNTALSDVIIGAIINKTATTTRFTDNNQDEAALSTLWINDNMTMEPATQVNENDDINFFTSRIDIIQDAATTPILRAYTLRGTVRQTTLARQPGDMRLELFRLE